MITYDYSGKSVFITGAGSGFGRLAALTFATSGANLTLCDINEEGVEETATLAREKGVQVVAVKCDVADKDQVRATLEKAVEVFGQIDIAVNNAGVEHELKPIVQCDVEEWDRTININLRGVFFCLKYELTQMIKQGGGTILNVASVAGLGGAPLMGPYAASKHGVVGLTKTAAVESARFNIRVNAICPGITQTPMLDRYLETQSGEDTVKKMAAPIPMRRFGRAEEIVSGMMWICSEENAYMTGHCLTFDGGLTAS